MLQIDAAYPPDALRVIAVNNTASAQWLKDYATSRSITYPFVYDEGDALFESYQVGENYGNTPPTYLIIDKKGNVRYRTDNLYNQFDEMKILVGELIHEDTE